MAISKLKLVVQAVAEVPDSCDGVSKSFAISATTTLPQCGFYVDVVVCVVFILVANIAAILIAGCRSGSLFAHTHVNDPREMHVTLFESDGPLPGWNAVWWT